MSGARATITDRWWSLWLVVSTLGRSCFRSQGSLSRSDRSWKIEILPRSDLSVAIAGVHSQYEFLAKLIRKVTIDRWSLALQVVVDPLELFFDARGPTFLGGPADALPVDADEDVALVEV